MTLAEVTDVIEVAIHQMVTIDGRHPEKIAQHYGLTVEDVREVYRRASQSNESRFGSNSAMWRHYLIEASLFDMAQLQGAWEKSTTRKRIKTTKTGGKFSPIVERTVEDRCGDPRFLSVKTQVLGAIAKLSGAEAPKELNINTRSEHDITVRLESMSDEELEKLATLARLEQEGVIQVDAIDVKTIPQQKWGNDGAVPADGNVENESGVDSSLAE